MIDLKLNDKTVLISGANHGIGAATALAFGAQGARVFITYYRDAPEYSAEKLEQARTENRGGPLLYAAKHAQSADIILEKIRSQGGTAAAHEADLSVPENIPDLFNRCERELGPVDILVNNHTFCVMETFDPAQITIHDSEEEFPIRLPDPEIIDAHFQINARAYALMMSEYFQRCIKRGAKWGRVINLSTDAAHGHESNVSYAASKHAIESYTRSAAMEMGKYGFTVNSVAPGPIQTGYIPPDAEKEIARKTPLGRIGEPKDVADVILFLASEHARWLTGQLFFVGGGWRMGQ